jgi:hypothetical protein
MSKSTFYGGWRGGGAYFSYYVLSLFYFFWFPHDVYREEYLHH